MNQLLTRPFWSGFFLFPICLWIIEEDPYDNIWAKKHFDPDVIHFEFRDSSCSCTLKVTREPQVSNGSSQVWDLKEVWSEAEKQSQLVLDYWSVAFILSVYSWRSWTTVQMWMKSSSRRTERGVPWDQRKRLSRSLLSQFQKLRVSATSSYLVLS